MARDTCVRCGATLHTTTDAPGTHVCKDISARLKRQTAQVGATMEVLGAFVDADQTTLRLMSQAVVAKLNRLGITED